MLKWRSYHFWTEPYPVRARGNVNLKLIFLSNDDFFYGLSSGFSTSNSQTHYTGRGTGRVNPFWTWFRWTVFIFPSPRRTLRKFGDPKMLKITISSNLAFVVHTSRLQVAAKSISTATWAQNTWIMYNQPCTAGSHLQVIANQDSGSTKHLTIEQTLNRHWTLNIEHWTLNIEQTFFVQMHPLFDRSPSTASDNPYVGTIF